MRTKVEIDIHNSKNISYLFFRKMNEEEGIDMSWNSDKELAILISCIKSPIWIEGQEDFNIKCHIREFLQKCSGGKIVTMLKSVLSTEEKTALVKTELESFFQSQAQSFENYMKIKNEPVFSNDIKIKTEPMSIKSNKEMSNKISLAKERGCDKGQGRD